MSPYFTVIINNYNYGRFLKQAVESVLSQSCASFQLIIVDDGSCDESIDVLRLYREDDRIMIIQKENAGQLSCFNAAIPYVKGEVVCFLDADDMFMSNYLDALRRIYEHNDIEYVFCNYSYFGKMEGPGFQEKKIIRFGHLRHLALNAPSFISGPTSTISMRREIYRKILPAPEFEKRFITQADDILAIGADIFDARKVYIPDQLILYRVHGGNYWFGRTEDLERRATHRQALAEFCLAHKPENYALEALPLLREIWQSPFPRKYKSLLRMKFGCPGGWLAKCMGFIWPGPLFTDTYSFFRRFRL